MTVAGSDLQLIKRVEGEFFSRFELHKFPFDVQVSCPKYFLYMLHDMHMFLFLVYPALYFYLYYLVLDAHYTL